ncbi:YitT family protein [Coprothermobacteraceae bacterium]|nr:YitT family protein [Coprothermobacteraceae bacterium]
MIDSFRRSVPRWRDVLLIVLGSLITAVGLVCFLFPHNLAPGGVGGLSLVLNHFIPAVSIGIWMLALNLVLFALAFMLLGSHIGVGTLMGTVLLSAFVDGIGRFYSGPFTQDLMLSAIYGGAIVGIGLGLVFKGRATTGGTDIVGFILNKFFGLSVGQGIFMADAAVVTILGLVFKSVDVALLAIVSVFVSSWAIDIVEKGLIRERVFIIISDNYERILEVVDKELGRGATLVQSWGAFSNKERRALVVAVSQSEAAELERIIHSSDPQSFYLVFEGVRVVGEGFRVPNWV